MRGRYRAFSNTIWRDNENVNSDKLMKYITFSYRVLVMLRIKTSKTAVTLSFDGPAPWLTGPVNERMMK
jgi:N-methylhydantoinase B/oxoprolinase/acetone carboxylase alpha subunit